MLDRFGQLVLVVVHEGLAQVGAEPFEVLDRDPQLPRVRRERDLEADRRDGGHGALGRILRKIGVLLPEGPLDDLRDRQGFRGRHVGIPVLQDVEDTRDRVAAQDELRGTPAAVTDALGDDDAPRGIFGLQLVGTVGVPGIELRVVIDRGASGDEREPGDGRTAEVELLRHGVFSLLLFGR